jgi:Leucine-rich repeat (LRR) protein
MDRRMRAEPGRVRLSALLRVFDLLAGGPNMKQFAFSMLAGLAAGAVLLAAGPATPTTDAAGIFPDKNLEAAVRKHVFAKRDNTQPFTEDDVKSLSVITANGAGIHNLAGLEKCKALAQLELANNEVSDLTPLKDLANLQSLDLANNKIHDISPLAGVKALQYLNLTQNQVTNIAAVKDLTALNALYLSKNKVSDLTPLSGLNRLSSLYLDGNLVKDLTPLASLPFLSMLDLSGNQITDLKPLEKMTSLWKLYLDRNRVADLSPLIALAKAGQPGTPRFVTVTGNPLKPATKSAQMAELQKLSMMVTP